MAHEEQNERVRRLLAEIEESKRDFEREVLSRRRLLSTLEPPPPADPLIAAIDEQWKRLSEDYHAHRKHLCAPRRKGGDDV